MPIDETFVVAFELGSSKITAVAGRRKPDGSIEIRAFAKNDAPGCIRKGRIYNYPKTTDCLVDLKERLEGKLKKRIARAYVGVGGYGLRSALSEIPRLGTAKVEITHDLIDSICEDNLRTAPENREIVLPVLQHYKVDMQETLEPVGLKAENISGKFLNVLAKNETRKDIEGCFREAKMLVADMPVTEWRLAQAMVPESQRRSGCVFVNIGAETTSVLVIRNNILRHVAVLPLGSNNINMDLAASLKIEETEAEELKATRGAAIYSAEDKAANPPFTRNDGDKQNFTEFAEVVEARMREILLNVKHQIELSGCDRSRLVGGIIVTGGGARIRNLEKAVMEITKFEKVKVTNDVLLTIRAPKAGGELFNRDGSFNGAIAILNQATENCSGGDLSEEGTDIFGTDENRPATDETATGENAGKVEEKPDETATEVDEEPEARMPGAFSKFWSRFKKGVKVIGDKINEED